MYTIPEPTKVGYWPALRVTLEERQEFKALAHDLRLSYSDLTRAALRLLAATCTQHDAPHGKGGDAGDKPRRAAMYPYSTLRTGERQAVYHEPATGEVGL